MPKRQKKNEVVRPVSDTAKPVFPPKKTKKEELEWSRLTAWPIECLTKSEIRKGIEAAHWGGEWFGLDPDNDDEGSDREAYCQFVVHRAVKLKIVNDIEWRLWVTLGEGVDPRQAAWSAAVSKARRKRREGEES